MLPSYRCSRNSIFPLGLLSPIQKSCFLADAMHTASKLFLIFIAFLGEEYGWRYYLQPILQKKLGMVRGIFVLGIAWGVWHLPINFFYYTSPSLGIISVTGQLIICVTKRFFKIKM